MRKHGHPAQRNEDGNKRQQRFPHGGRRAFAECSGVAGNCHGRGQTGLAGTFPTEDGGPWRASLAPPSRVQKKDGFPIPVLVLVCWRCWCMSRNGSGRVPSLWRLGKTGLSDCRPRNGLGNRHAPRIFRLPRGITENVARQVEGAAGGEEVPDGKWHGGTSPASPAQLIWTGLEEITSGGRIPLRLPFNLAAWRCSARMASTRRDAPQTGESRSISAA